LIWTDIDVRMRISPDAVPVHHSPDALAADALALSAQFGVDA